MFLLSMVVALRACVNNMDYKPYFEGTNFGSTNYDHLILEGLMKINCGYANGMTINNILQKLEYIVPMSKNVFIVNKHGYKAMYDLYEKLLSSKWT